MQRYWGPQQAKRSLSSYRKQGWAEIGQEKKSQRSHFSHPVMFARHARMTSFHPYLRGPKHFDGRDKRGQEEGIWRLQDCMTVSSKEEGIWEYKWDCQCSFKKKKRNFVLMQVWWKNRNLWTLPCDQARPSGWDHCAWRWCGLRLWASSGEEGFKWKYTIWSMHLKYRYLMVGSWMVMYFLVKTITLSVLRIDQPFSALGRHKRRFLYQIRMLH